MAAGGEPAMRPSLRKRGLALSALAVLGALAFLLLGWVALIFTGFGAAAGEGPANSQPAVLALILVPVAAPLAGWLALSHRRPALALALAHTGIVPALLWLGLWLRAG